MSALLLRLAVFSLLSFSSLAQLPSQDILALLEFKKGIKHDPTGFVIDSWNDESIDFNGCPSSWNGIMCNGGSVAAVVLDNLGLTAEADLSVFANLTKLVKLSISNNSFSGQLPKNVGDFKSLEYLDVSDNLFSSVLPDDLGQLPGLKNLSLAGNNFSGQIPDLISGLSSIRSLDFSRNSLTGQLPSSLMRLGGLIYLNLSLNGFVKTVPKGLELLTQLETIDMHGNMLEGDFDREFIALTTASYVDLSSNLLENNAASGKESLFAGVSTSIKHLNLSHNKLTGSLVGGGGGARDFEGLKVLDLSYNQLSGELPGFSFVYELEVLRLGNNMFAGSIPNNLLKGGDSSVLTELDLSGNNLAGMISMITSTTLQVLNLSSNSISGELPLLTGSCVVLDLSKNQFEGSLTRTTKWGNNIEILDLSQNRLTGPFPETTAQFLRLNHLNLSSNSLNDSLPEVITRLPRLTSLDLSFNRFTGALLAALFTSPTLNELRVRGNELSGGFNFSAPADSKLVAVDLSDNRFNGALPGELGSFTELRFLYLGGNNFSGSIPNSIENITGLAALDLSRNNFTGPLPKNFSDGLQSFNASYNDLSGVVPENLRRFPLSSFYPGNSRLQFPNPPPGSGRNPARKPGRKHLRTIIIIAIVLSCVVALIFLILVALLITRHKRRRRQALPLVAKKDVSRQTSTTTTTTPSTRERAQGLVVSAEDLVRKGTSSEIVASPEEKQTGHSPAKTSHFSWSPESGESYAGEGLSKLEARSPDRLAGELYFLDDTVAFTAEELSKAPAEVLGRSSHGTSYRATLEGGLFLTVKWLREGVAKQRKEFAKEAKKFANIRHPNVVGLRGYYWGPTQHEKLILSDYISPGSLASFLYDRPGRKGPPLTWAQRLKIAVDVARGLNYLHFDRAVPHGNLKATNVLLDGPDLNGRVADYCLHRLMTHSGTVEQILDAGVLGYRAPELAQSKKPVPSFKSDVYAFGVILLELLTGKCAGDVVSGEDGGVDLTDWVRIRVSEGKGSECFDGVLLPEMGIPASDKGMKEVLGIALRCIRSVSERPGIKTIYEDLSSV